MVGSDVEAVIAIELLWTISEPYDSSINVVPINHFSPLLSLPIVFCDVVCVDSGIIEPDMVSSDSAGSPAKVDCALKVEHGNQLHGHYLGLRPCVEVLRNPTANTVYDEVPTGIKSNIWCVVKVSIDDAERNTFCDDCRAWVGGHGTKSYHLSDTLVEARLSDGQYTKRCQKDGKIAVVVLDPQPHNVICVCRYYSTLGRDKHYTRASHMPNVLIMHLWSI